MLETNNNIQSINQSVNQSNKKSSDINLTNLPDNLKISTITITCKLNTLIDTQNVGKYVDLMFGGIVTVKHGPNNDIRTIVKVKEKKKSKKKIIKCKKNFYNQATLVIDIKDKKRINVKLFKNGAIQMTGCKSMEHFDDALLIVCQELTKKKAIYNKLTKKIINKPFVTNPENVKVDKMYDLKIKMINSNYSVGFLINQKILQQILYKSNVVSSYEPCIHACVNVKYNYKNTDVISIFVFEKGSIMITGAKSKDHIVEAYRFINGILYENFSKIVKNNIDDFLKKKEIQNIINKSKIVNKQSN